VLLCTLCYILGGNTVNVALASKMQVSRQLLQGLTDDNQHEKLVEAYENISQSMTRNQDAMDTLDTEQSNLQQELDIDENQIQNQDSAFAKWTSEMQTESTPASIPELINSQHNDSHTAKQLKQKHQRDQLDRSLQGAYG